MRLAVSIVLVVFLAAPRVGAAEGQPAVAELQVPSAEICAGAGCDEGAAHDPLERPDDWREPNVWRAVSEIGLVLFTGATWYWIDRERQVADWDFPSLRDRFSTDIFINDNNPFTINYLWHGFGGSGFHLLGRANDIGLISSTALGLGASLAWEYGIEYREKISLNDIIFTTTAGMAGGEFLHWLGRWLQQERGGVGRSIARWTVGLPQSAHDSLDGRLKPRGPLVEHEFRAAAGTGLVSTSVADQGIGSIGHMRFYGELIALPGHRDPGQVSGVFRDANFTSLDLRLTGGDGGGAYLLADTMLAGWRRQDIPSSEEGGLGTAFNLGTAVALRYSTEELGAWRDRLGAVHMPGLAADADLLGVGWRLRGKARLHVDYAGVHARTYGQWRDAYPDEVGKSILEQQGYYYAWGWSTRLGAELEAGRLALGSALFYGRYGSQDGLDRHQEMLTIDQQANDRYLDLEAWVRVRFFRDLFVEARSSDHRRRGTLEEFAGSAQLRRHQLEVGTYF